MGRALYFQFWDWMAFWACSSVVKFRCRKGSFSPLCKSKLARCNFWNFLYLSCFETFCIYLVSCVQGGRGRAWSSKYIRKKQFSWNTALAFVFPLSARATFRTFSFLFRINSFISDFIHFGSDAFSNEMSRSLGLWYKVWNNMSLMVRIWASKWNEWNQIVNDSIKFVS